MIALPTITELRVQQKNRQRINVSLDGQFAFGLSSSLAARLRVGVALSDEEIKALQEQDSVEIARRRAMRLISRRPRSERELRRYFDRHAIPEPVQEAALSQLRRAELLDDGVFAETWVENRTAFRPRGALALRSELKAKGVPRRAIEAALENFDEEAAAAEAGRKAARRYQHLSENDFRQRVGAYLGRRGFRYPMIASVVDRLWQSAADDESEVHR